MANNDFESTYSVRRKNDGRWCVLQTQADGSKREICDFVTDREARDWIVGKTGKPMPNSAVEWLRVHAGAVDVKIKAIKAAISKIPIVFATGGDLVELGVVASMNRPGGNATGVTVLSAELWPKQLELLRKLAGSPNLIAVLVNPNNVTTRASVRIVEAAARAINQNVLIVNAGTEGDFESEFATLVQKRAGGAASSFAIGVSAAPVHAKDEIEGVIAAQARNPGGGLFVMPDVYNDANRELIIALTARYGVPAIYYNRFFSELGGLISYGDVRGENFHLAAGYIDRILKGEKPADLPVQAPTKFELVINLKTAKALGLEVPPTLLAQADAVIE